MADRVSASARRRSTLLLLLATSADAREGSAPALDGAHVQVRAERLCSKRFGSQVAFRYALEAMLGRRACWPLSFHVRRSSSRIVCAACSVRRSASQVSVRCALRMRARQRREHRDLVRTSDPSQHSTALNCAALSGAYSRSSRLGWPSLATMPCVQGGVLARPRRRPLVRLTVAAWDVIPAGGRMLGRRGAGPC